MKIKKKLVYVLSGAWDTFNNDGSIVAGISEEVEPLQDKLQHIIDSKAVEFLKNPVEPVAQEIGERHYEIIDSDGNYAKFYITEHYVENSKLST